MNELSSTPVDLVQRSSRHPIIREISETVLLQRDLHTSLAGLELWNVKRQSQLTPELELMVNALFRDSIVQFVACFQKAEVQLHPHILFTENEHATAYAEALAMRNSLAAHRFGGLRMGVTSVLLWPDTLAYAGLMPFCAQWLGPDQAGYERLHRIMQIAVTHIDERLSVVIAEADAIFRAMPLDQIAALPPPLQVVGPRQSELGASRGEILRRSEEGNSNS